MATVTAGLADSAAAMRRGPCKLTIRSVAQTDDEVSHLQQLLAQERAARLQAEQLLSQERVARQKAERALDAVTSVHAAEPKSMHGNNLEMKTPATPRRDSSSDAILVVARLGHDESPGKTPIHLSPTRIVYGALATPPVTPIHLRETAAWQWASSLGFKFDSPTHSPNMFPSQLHGPSLAEAPLGELGPKELQKTLTVPLAVLTDEAVARATAASAIEAALADGTEPRQLPRQQAAKPIAAAATSAGLARAKTSARFSSVATAYNFLPPELQVLQVPEPDSESGAEASEAAGLASCTDGGDHRRGSIASCAASAAAVGAASSLRKARERAKSLQPMSPAEVGAAAGPATAPGRRRGTLSHETGLWLRSSVTQARAAQALSAVAGAARFGSKRYSVGGGQQRARSLYAESAEVGTVSPPALTAALSSALPFASAAAASAPGREALPDGWEAVTDSHGRVYFWHEGSDEVSWTRPTAGSAAGAAPIVADPSAAPAAAAATDVTSAMDAAVDAGYRGRAPVEVAVPIRAASCSDASGVSCFGTTGPDSAATTTSVLAAAAAASTCDAPAADDASAKADATETLSPLPAGWEAVVDTFGRVYFWHQTTDEVSWTQPTAGGAAEAASDEAMADKAALFDASLGPAVGAAEPKAAWPANPRFPKRWTQRWLHAGGRISRASALLSASRLKGSAARAVANRKVNRMANPQAIERARLAKHSDSNLAV